MYFKKILNLFLTSILLWITNIVPARANTNAIILKEVSILNSTVYPEDELEVYLKFHIPKDFSWDPTLTKPYGDVRVIYCEELKLDGFSCSFSTSMSNFTIQNIIEFSSNEFELYKEISVIMKGKINSGIEGKYVLWSVRIFGADLPFRHEIHVYLRGKSYAEELSEPRTDILVPTLSVGDFSVVSPPTPEADVPPAIQDPPAPVVEVSPQRTRSSGSSQPEVSMPEPIVESVIQSNFYLPSVKGDENWRPLREIKGNFQDWKRLRKNSINGGMNQVTKKDGSLITFTSSGDSLSLRYLGGKKRGSFSIYVNGKFLERVDAKRNRKTLLIKTWEGLGTGKHYIDIVAELEAGQSLALNGIQRPRA